MPVFCGNLICRGKVGKDCNRPNIDSDKDDAVLSFVGVEQFRRNDSVGTIP